MKKIVKKPVRVALLATVVGYGGSEKVLLTLMEHIDRKQIELIPVLFTRPGEADNFFFKELDRSGRPYHRIYVNNHRIKYLNPAVNFLSTYRLFKRERFDIIHTNGYRADILGIIISKMAGLPSMSTCHGYISTNLKLRAYNALDRFILRYSTRVLAVSEELKAVLITGGVKKTNVEVIENAVRTIPGLDQKNRREKRRVLSLKDDDFVIGYSGRLSEEKGVEYLIKAMDLLKKEGLPVKAVIMGEGHLRAGLEGLVKENMLEQSVQFTGFKSPIEEWIPALDVFVLPSLTEGTPMSLLEAMALGIPSIATRVGGVPNVIRHGANGFLISTRSPEEIRDSVIRLYSDRGLCESITNKARATINSSYNTRKWAAKIEGEYKRIRVTAE
ncbi:MAG: glycosyltransferase family 4 protein [Deltaproteobacteria bacterium]|nr:glycosyltransferase family 4 protein [Deltaproteobacteria bacterium]